MTLAVEQMVSQYSPINHMHWFQRLGLAARFVAYNFHLLFYISFRSVHAL
jgi:hypothetical protein